MLLVNHSGVYGGAEFQLVDIARHWGSAGHTLLFAGGPVAADLVAGGIGVDILAADEALIGVRRETRRPSRAAVRSVLRLARAVARYAADYDLVFANSQKAFVVAALAALLARKPLVWYLHDIMDANHFSATNTRVAVWLANIVAARVLVNSAATGDAFVAAGGRSRKVGNLPTGIDPAPFLAVRDGDIAPTRAALGIPPGAALLGVFGRLVHWKGQHVALAAVARIPDAHLLIVGAAMFGEQDYAQGLRNQAETLGIADRVHFLGFRNDIALLMRVVDIVLHTSVAAEPFGRVIVEGMLAGRAVIATDAGGTREIVQVGETGLLVAPDDVEALRAAISRLLVDGARREAFGVAGRQRALAHFSLAALLACVDSEIRRVTQS